MSNYLKVQFISWEVCTGPDHANDTYHGLSDTKNLPSDHEGKKNLITDLNGQCMDIEARVAFTADAIEKAYQKADKSPDVLKIFLAPEFLYRGAAGAYFHDLINGWEQAPFGPEGELPLRKEYRGKWEGLFGKLRNLVKNEKYEDWIFAFGSAVSASFENPESTVLEHRYGATVFNTTLVQRGNRDVLKGGAHVCRKRILTENEFLPAYIIGKARKLTFHVERGASEPDFDSNNRCEDADVPYDGGVHFKLDDVADFNGDSIQFGIEICLDHTHHYDPHAKTEGEPIEPGRVRRSGRPVRIQLVPSCGLKVMDPTLDQTRNSYLFNCDGSNLTSRVSTEIYARDDRPALSFQSVNVADNVMATGQSVAATQLWDDGKPGGAGAGRVRIATPLPL
jgi:hypothetical protein